MVAAALAVGEVKQWGVNLSKKTGMLPIFDDQNPMFQIDTYLTLTGLEWGILSNGRCRLLLAFLQPGRLPPRRTGPHFPG